VVDRPSCRRPLAAPPSPCSKSSRRLKISPRGAVGLEVAEYVAKASRVINAGTDSPERRPSPECRTAGLGLRVDEQAGHRPADFDIWRVCPVGKCNSVRAISSTCGSDFRNPDRIAVLPYAGASSRPRPRMPMRLRLAFPARSCRGRCPTGRSTYRLGGVLFSETDLRVIDGAVDEFADSILIEAGLPFVFPLKAGVESCRSLTSVTVHHLMHDHVVSIEETCPEQRTSRQKPAYGAGR